MIRVVHADFLPFPDPGSRGQKGTGSLIPDPDPQHLCVPYRMFYDGIRLCIQIDDYGSVIRTVKLIPYRRSSVF
jgi:hypothetical protein